MSEDKRSLRAEEQKKRIEHVVRFALNHKTRLHILVLLHEGTYTPKQIAEIIDEPLNNVSNHIKALVERGSIAVAKTAMVRNAEQHWYRAELPNCSKEDIAAMTPQQRQVTAGLVIQSMVAEIMVGLWAGKMQADPRVWLNWNWFNVDDQGWNEIAAEQERSQERFEQIEIEAINRCAETGEETVSVLVSQTSFERARKGPLRGRSSPDE